MLEYELHGRQLPDGELRRVAEDVWLRFFDKESPGRVGASSRQPKEKA
jgi:hypothetical protein